MLETISTIISIIAFVVIIITAVYQLISSIKMDKRMMEQHEEFMKKLKKGE